MPLPLWFWTTFWTIILVLLIMVFTIILLIIATKSKKIPDIERDTKVICLFNDFSNGHSEGWLTGEKSVNGRKLISFVPTDLTKKEIEELNEIPLETIAVASSQIHIAPRGTFSNAYSIMYILSKNISDIIKKLPKTLGDGFAKATIIEQIKADHLDSITQGNKARNWLWKQQADGELSRDTLLKLEELYQKALEKKVETQQENAQARVIP